MLRGHIDHRKQSLVADTPLGVEHSVSPVEYTAQLGCTYVLVVDSGARLVVGAVRAVRWGARWVRGSVQNRLVGRVE